VTNGLGPYPEYRESGVAWLGEVPAHWEVRRNKQLFREVVDPSVDGSEELLTVSQFSGVTRRRDGRASEDDLVTRAASLVGYKRAKAGDLVMNIMLAWNGSLGVSAIDGIASPAYCVFRPNAAIRPVYAHHLLRTPVFKDAFKSVSTGVVDSRLRLYPDVFMRLPSVVPPRGEQDAIVRYLDAADRRIKRYIHAKQRLIALLGEQKRLIVHRAVTRGLGPDVALKPSGVDWLGDVPVHWRVLRLRHAAEMMVSNVDKLTTSGEQLVRLCNYVDVYKNERITHDLAFMAATASHEEIERFRVRIGDVLITKDSEAWDDIGVPALVDYEAPDLVCGYHLAMLRPRSDVVLGAYLLRVLQSQGVATQLHIGANGVTRFGLTQGAIKDALVAVPPLDEQARITEHIDAALGALHVTAARVTKEIALLREYRTRLVADVVTGKLDVRAAAASLSNDVDQMDASLDHNGETSDDPAGEDATDLEPAEA